MFQEVDSRECKFKKEENISSKIQTLKKTLAPLLRPKLSTKIPKS